MQFTTKVPIPKATHPIDYDSKIVALGSCFAENMAVKFDYFRFRNTTNPFGIIFNPVSIENLMARVAEKREFTGEDVFFHNERWQSYEVHSDLCHIDKTKLLELLNRTLEQTRNQIIEATHIIITYGTSWVYRLRSTGAVVANCHKVPQAEFEKQLLSAAQIERSIENTISLIRKVNPGCSFMFTVSPVRHIKDGFVENNVGKAQLLSAVYASRSRPFSAYFPSFEIMMDELRDYRFYADDMLHPSQSAIDYIWECFFRSQMQESVFPVMDEVCSIQKSLRHKPFHADSQSHRKFVENLEGKIAALALKFPQIRF